MKPLGLKPLSLSDLDSLPAAMSFQETCERLGFSASWGYLLRDQKRWPLPQHAEFRIGRRRMFRGEVVKAFLLGTLETRPSLRRIV